MKKHTYEKPWIMIHTIHLQSLMAGSYVEQGQTDGQGTGQFEASAKQSSSLFDYDYDDEE